MFPLSIYKDCTTATLFDHSVNESVTYNVHLLSTSLTASSNDLVCVGVVRPPTSGRSISPHTLATHRLRHLLTHFLRLCTHLEPIVRRQSLSLWFSAGSVARSAVIDLLCDGAVCWSVVFFVVRLLQLHPLFFLQNQQAPSDRVGIAYEITHRRNSFCRPVHSASSCIVRPQGGSATIDRHRSVQHPLFNAGVNSRSHGRPSCVFHICILFSALSIPFL